MFLYYQKIDKKINPHPTAGAMSKKNGELRISCPCRFARGNKVKPRNFYLTILIFIVLP